MSPSAPFTAASLEKFLGFRGTVDELPDFERALGRSPNLFTSNDEKSESDRAKAEFAGFVLRSLSLFREASGSLGPGWAPILVELAIIDDDSVHRWDTLSADEQANACTRLPRSDCYFMKLGM